MPTIIREVVDDQGNILREEVIEEQSPWMRISDAARYHNVSTWTINQWIKQGVLTRYQAPGSVHLVRLKRSEVENIFQPQATTSE